LRVLVVPSCGWSDLGTAQRVTRTVHRYSCGNVSSGNLRPRNAAAYLDLVRWIADGAADAVTTVRPT
jgi:hypothetical protein